MKNPLKQQWSVIKCHSIYDKGRPVATFTGLFSWFKAMNFCKYLSSMDRDGFIWGVANRK